MIEKTPIISCSSISKSFEGIYFFFKKLKFEVFAKKNIDFFCFRAFITLFQLSVGYVMFSCVLHSFQLLVGYVFECFILNQLSEHSVLLAQQPDILVY